jgi:hypothetical protein
VYPEVSGFHISNSSLKVDKLSSYTDMNQQMGKYWDSKRIKLTNKLKRTQSVDGITRRVK